MSDHEEGIWVRLGLDDGSDVSGFAVGADTPNDFWLKFRTQLVQLQDARVNHEDRSDTKHDRLYVNRDRIRTVEVLPEQP